jgi:lysine-specific demethylase 3
MLEQPKDSLNIHLFQEQWIRGQPVLICNSSELLNKHLWHPQAFYKDFGHLNHDLVNCLTGKTIPKAPLTRFWAGFQTIKYRMTDEKGTCLALMLF